MELTDMITKEGRRRNYSAKTIESYQAYVKRFFEYCKKEPKRVTKKDIREFLDKLIERGQSGNTINVNLNAFRFVFEDLLRRRIRLNIRYSKKPLQLPVFLEKEEVKAFLDSVENEKHRLMVELMYSAGLRVSELCNLRVKHLEIDKGYGFVRKGKGKKDRVFIIAEYVKQKIKSLIESEQLNAEDWLFMSNRKRQYDVRTIEEIVKKARKKAGIVKNIHPHTLRHSFATHLIENGYSLTEVQSLLGHKSPETSMIYIHLATPRMLNVKSPLDSLNEEKTVAMDLKKKPPEPP